MVSEPDIGQCANDDIRLQEGLWDDTLVGEENETFIIRVGKSQSRQYLLSMDLGCYKWYQSQTPDGVPAMTKFSRGVNQSQTPDGVPAMTKFSRGVNCEITRRLEGERNIPSKSVEISL